MKSKNIQTSYLNPRDLILSIQGNRGSYSHIAASTLFGKDISLLERDAFTEVFDDLEEGRAEAIVVPFENSTYGSVFQNYDNITKYDFPVIAEIYLKINFHLIAHPGTKIEDLTEIYSHPVGLPQIKRFLDEHPRIKPIEYPDTAGSVVMIKEKKLKHSAAAASRFAAELNGMKILQEAIQENSKNVTRFFVITKQESIDKILQEIKPQSGSGKTTIQFQLGKEAGSLYKSLRCFADRDIALTKIESRPILDTDWEYRFYVDVMADVIDEKTQNAIKELHDYVRELKVLGSYKEGEYIDT